MYSSEEDITENEANNNNTSTMNNINKVNVSDNNQQFLNGRSNDILFRQFNDESLIDSPTPTTIVDNNVAALSSNANSDRKRSRRNMVVDDSAFDDILGQSK